ncbi:hypothetical protein KR038_006403 [Drosophila bunnanda]|nr:hypothetical protein KR038_006403 [Drosophila bunnanda]
MAELDDFFAKKDKKKGKKSTKFVTADELVKNLEDGSKRELVKPKKPEAVAGGVAVAGENETSAKVSESVAPVEEEWKEFVEEQRKDYSGLKIGQLSTINSPHRRTATEPAEVRADRVPTASDGASYDEEEEDRNGYDNAEASEKGVGHGPWKKVIPAEEVMQIPVPVEVEKPYVTPALRYSQQAGLGSALGGGSAGGGLRPRRAAPDITNTEFFPTLSAARPEEQRKKKNEPAFEEVRHGGRFQRVQETTSAPVAASNRFQSLDDEAS